jgi:hypothetical protein
MDNQNILELKKKINENINKLTKFKEIIITSISFLFQQLNNINQLEKIQKLPSKYLAAYMLLNEAEYSNYQTELFPYVKIDNTDNLIERITSELKISERKYIDNIIKELERFVELKTIDLNAIYIRLEKLNNR